MSIFPKFPDVLRVLDPTDGITRAVEVLRGVEELTALFKGATSKPNEKVKSTYNEYVTKLAKDAVESEADMALWTNRVPDHEPWGRMLKCQPMKDPNATQKYNDPKGMAYEDLDPPQRQDINRHHDNEFSDESAWVGRAEGDELIERNQVWRR